MKKLITGLCLIMIATPVFAVELTTKQEKNLFYLYEKLEKTKSVDDFNAAADYYFKLYKNETPSNPEIADQMVAINYDRYNTTQLKKYKHYAQKYINVAMKYDTQDVNTLIYGMCLATEDLDTNRMVKYYDYICKINPKAGQAIKSTFAEQIANVNNQKAANTSNKWAVVNSMLYTYIQNRPQRTYSTTTGTIDANGFVNLNTTSY